jgi:hypothetical protein
MVDSKENKVKRGCIPGELDAGADDGAGSLVTGIYDGGVRPERGQRPGGRGGGWSSQQR